MPLCRASAFSDLTAELHCISSVVSAPKFRSASLTRHEYYSLERRVYSRDIDRWTICCKSTWATNVQYKSYFMAICLQVGYYSAVNAKRISLFWGIRELPSFLLPQFTRVRSWLQAVNAKIGIYKPSGFCGPQCRGGTKLTLMNCTTQSTLPTLRMLCSKSNTCTSHCLPCPSAGVCQGFPISPILVRINLFMSGNQISVRAGVMLEERDGEYYSQRHVTFLPQKYCMCLIS